MTQEMKNEWIMLFAELVEASEDCEKRGLKAKAAEYSAQAEGMRTALEIFGYTVQEQYNEFLKGNELVIVKEG